MKMTTIQMSSNNQTTILRMDASEIKQTINTIEPGIAIAKLYHTPEQGLADPTCLVLLRMQSLAPPPSPTNPKPLPKP